MEWKEYQIQDVCRLINGRAYSNDEMLEHGKYKIVRVGNLSGGNSTWFYSDLELPADKYCHNGDLLFAWACTFGPHIWKEDNTIFHYHIWKIVEDKDVVDRRFFCYYLKFATGGFLGALNGSVMVHITKSSMEKMIIRIPKKLEDQRRIASILSSLDRKIELNNKINADLEEMAQAVFKNWFVDFEPFKDGKFVDSELGMIPEGWKVGTLEDIAEITMGQSPAGNGLNENGEGMIFYQGSSDFGFRFPSIRVFTTEPKRLAVANSVLFSVRAPVGDINVAKEECCIGRGVASIKSKYGHDSYLFYAMKSLHKLFDSFDGEGTVFGSINKKTLSAIQILLPSDGIVEQFNNVASSFDDRIRSLSDENSRLSLLRDTLLPRLMSGELEVPE